MVIKEGYKQTEIGVIPIDWEAKSYDEVFHFLNTATYSRAELTELDEIKYVHYGDIHTKFHFHLDVNNSYLPSVPQTKLKNYSLLKEGDIIMADASEDYLGIGKSIEIKNLGDKKIISGLHTFLFRDKNNYFTNGYKGYIHSINLVKKQFDSLATGMKVYGVSKNNLKKILIPIPTLAEQTAIAIALSDADRLITGLEKLIAKKRNIKQGAMQQLLQPKEGWQVKKLGEVAEIYQPLTISQDVFINDGYLVYGANGIVGKYHLFNHETWQTTITCRGSTCGTVNRTVGKSWITGNAMVMNVDRNNNIDKLFFYYILTKQDFRLCITGSGQPQIIRKPLFEFKISIPINIAEQIQIATILSDMDAELSALEQKLEKYKKVKLGMMQELLTGKTRLV